MQKHKYRPWYKPFKFCDKICGKGRNTDEEALLDTNDHDSIRDTKIENVDESVVGSPFLRFENLTKIYGSDNEAKKNIAVNKLNLSFYKGQGLYNEKCIL